MFRDLTFPLFRPLLEASSSGSTVVATGASLVGQPVGLALAEMAGDAAELHSVAVASTHRRAGLAFRLLGALEQELLHHNINSVRATFMSNLPQTPAITALLAKANWSQPRHRMLVCDSDLPTIMQAPWMQNRELPRGFSLFPWAELTAAERNDLLEPGKSAWYPEALTPFRNEHLMDPATSLGLRYQGKLAGWCLTHLLDETTVRYSSLFVRHEHQGLGRAIPLLANSIFSLYKTHRFKARFDVALDNRPMFRFVHKRMSAYMLNVRYILSSEKMIRCPQQPCV